MFSISAFLVDRLFEDENVDKNVPLKPLFTSTHQLIQTLFISEKSARFCVFSSTFRACFDHRMGFDDEIVILPYNIVFLHENQRFNVVRMFLFDL